MRKTCLLLAVSVLLFPSGARAGLRVTATFLPVWILAKNVAGERAQVSLLVPPGIDVHGYSLRPRDVEKLHGADLVLLSGAGLDAHIARRIQDRERTIDTSEGIELVKTGLAPDPHIWLDPVRAMAQVENIRKAFSRADPDNKPYYEENADKYLERLRGLDNSLRDGLRGLKTRYLITYHESFGYFASRYGLVSYSLTGPDAEYALPGRMRAVYDIVRGQGIRAVFGEEQFQPEAMERLGRDLGVRVCTLDTMETGEPDAGYYERAMLKNLKTIRECLGTR
jgi:zinc/manganese transport system substrate-binding protein